MRKVDERGYVQKSSVNALKLKGPPNGGCSNRYFSLTLILGKCGERIGLETRVVSHPQTMGFQSRPFWSGL